MMMSSMVAAGHGEETIMEAIQTTEPGFETSAEALVALKNAGVGEKIIVVMLAPKRGKLGATAPFGFPQAEAQVLCDQEELRVSAWTNAHYLYVQAIVWADADDTVVETEIVRTRLQNWSKLPGSPASAA